MADWTNIDWATVITTVLGSGVVSALVGGFFASRRDERVASREAAHTALRAAIALENFARASAEVVVSYTAFDNQHPDDDRDDRLTRLPPPPAFPAHLDWRPVSAASASRALSFPAEVEYAAAHVAESFDFDVDVGIDEIQLTAARIGYRAWTLASDLRNEHGLPQLEVEQLGNWNYPELLAQRQHPTR